MTVTLELNPELEEHLAAQAARQGLSLEAYLLSIIETRVIPPEAVDVTLEEFEAEMDELSEGTDHIQVLAPEALTRESIYGNGPLSSPAAQPTEEQFERELMRSGILDEVHPPPHTRTPGLDRKPIDMKGKPLSETIVEDRR
jgi:hypothetical protein